jgi:hypothetical protein
MKKFLILFFSVLVAFAMYSCSDDSGVNVIDVPNGDDNGDEPTGTVYSITFDVEGGGTFTFSVDMEDAVIEGDDLPDDFDGDLFEFNPNNHKVFIAGSFVDWPEPGSESNLELTRQGAEPGITIDDGSGQFKFFIVPGSDPTWDYGEWEGDPNRQVDVESDGDYFAIWGDVPDVEEPDVDAPEELFMIGASVGSWDWDEIDLPMYPVHSHPGMFWKIVWIESGVDDAGFKFAPQQAWADDFGWDGDDPVDEIYGIGGDNMPEPDESGYYMVVVNWEEQQVSVTQPLVYLIGETIGSWDTAVEDALFTVDNDNEVITITRELEADELRMYAWFDKGWFTDWWQSEFMIFDGEIEFRGDGGDQDRVNLDEAGEYTIDLNFRENTGSIELQ